MKRTCFFLKSLLLLCTFVLLFLLLPSKTCLADDDGFYIENMDVQVTANSDRSYDIVETIDVYFTESRHGIKRNIPTSSSLEREVRIKNVKVKGAPFDYDGHGNIKIGDPDRTITGEKQYVISYTIWQYADTETDADYLYLNLIGTEWTTYIKKFNGSITLPEGAVVDSYTLTGGKYGDTESDMAECSILNNTVTITGTRQLEAYEGVTIMVKMPEGTFSDATVWEPSLVIHNITEDYKLDEYGVLTVEKTYDATVSHKEAMLIPTNDTIEDCNNKSYDIKAILPDGSTEELEGNSMYLSLDSYVGQRIQFTIQYKKAFEIPYDESSCCLSMHLYEYNDEYTLESLNIKFSLPYALEENAINCYPEFTCYNHHTPTSFTMDSVLQDGEIVLSDCEFTEDIYFHLKMPEAHFKRMHRIYDWLVPVIGIVLVILLVLLILNNRQILNPVPQFYPPDGMNPAEAGYLIDQTCSSSDIVSLIYYWASKGLIKIKFQDRKHFTLYKLGAMDNDARIYERSLFNHLWNQGQRTVTTDSDLRNSFYTHVNKTISNLKAVYIGNKALLDNKSARFSKLIGLFIPALYILLLIGADVSRGFGMEKPLYYGMCCYFGVPLLYSASSTFEKKRYRSCNFVSLLIRIGFVSALMSVYFTLQRNQQIIPDFASVIAFLATILLSTLAPFLRKRTPYGREELEKVMGFRMFLKTAEKDRLAMLLDENPDYYYDILPYAQVLGVSKQWIHRFDELTIQSPSWLESDQPWNSHDYMDFGKMTSLMTSSMTSSPSSSGSSSGGSYSSGGSSGGGSGGGGGSSW